MMRLSDEVDMEVVSRKSAEHYNWGGGCDGWHLLKADGLSVIEERMPASTSEVRHCHERAQQFFYILDGEAMVEIAGSRVQLGARQGVAVPAGVPHRLANETDGDLRFLVISSPESHGDRIIVDENSGGEA